MLLYCDVTGIEIVKKYFLKNYYNNLNLLEDEQSGGL
jgi:hypothetical protein